jgi:hypothetical protein
MKKNNIMRIVKAYLYMIFLITPVVFFSIIGIKYYSHIISNSNGMSYSLGVLYFFIFTLVLLVNFKFWKGYYYKELIAVPEKLESKSIESRFDEINKINKDFNIKVNDTELNLFRQRVSLLEKMYNTISKEFELRLDEEVQRKIDDFQGNIRAYPPEKLQSIMKDIYHEMNKSFNEIPESFKDIRNQMDNAVKQIKYQTEKIHKDGADVK